MIVAYTPHKFDQNSSDRGLAPYHAYVITGAFKTTINGVEEKLLRLANPWGEQDQYSGRFSDQGQIWQDIDEA